jgi:hypothetical protein
MFTEGDEIIDKLYFDLWDLDILSMAPDASELPMPPQKWLKKENVDELSLLDWATDEALEYYWKDRVKACQYAIFHMC